MTGILLNRFRWAGANPDGRRFRRTRRAAASRGGCPSTADDKGKEEKRKGSTYPFHSQHIAHRGACGKTRVVPQNRWPKPESTQMGVAKCACCRRWMGPMG